MIDIIFTVSLGVFFSAVYTAAFRVLPAEQWQVVASIPLHKNSSNTWHGVNVTFYGLLTSSGYTIAFMIFILMMTAGGVQLKSLLLLSTCILVMFIPSAKIMAFIIEKKKHTITIGGGVFIMFISAPWIITGVNAISGFIETGRTGEGVFLSSLITAYAFGEGFGRLACISFGCCYGRSLDSLPVFFQKIFSNFNFIYTGNTKKISYHDHMDGVKTVPVQAITAVLYTASGLTGLYLFLLGNYYHSFFLSLTVTQLWRFVSEFLRADFRGGGAISAYQVMSLFTIPYYITYFMITGMVYSPPPALVSGLKFIWSPEVIIITLIMWIGGVLYTGISSVTAAEIAIFVNEDKI